MTTLAVSSIEEKIQELCAAIVADDEVQEARANAEAFLADESAVEIYRQVARAGRELEQKQQHGVELSDAEIEAFNALQEKAEAIARVIARIRGAEGAAVGVSAGAMQLQVALDRPAIARYGLNVADVREAVETGIGGMEATTVLDGRRRIPVVVRLDAPYRSTPEAVGQTLIRTPAGGTVTLAQLAHLSTVEAPEVIDHEGGQRYVVVQSNVRGRDLGSFVADVKREVAAQVLRMNEMVSYQLSRAARREPHSRARSSVRSC